MHNSYDLFFNPRIYFHTRVTKPEKIHKITPKREVMLYDARRYMTENRLEVQIAILDFAHIFQKNYASDSYKMDVDVTRDI